MDVKKVNRYTGTQVHNLTCLLVSLFTCLLVSCSASTRPIIKIGLVAPFEGRYREVGEEVVYAVRLAVREANEAGGISGYSVELMAYDDMGDPDLAAEQAHKLVTDPQVVGVVGHWLESTSLAAAPIYADAGIPFLATTQSTDLDPAAFRLWHTNEQFRAYGEQLGATTICDADCSSSLEDLSSLQSLVSTQSVQSQVIGPPLWGLNQFPRLAGDAAESVFVITPSPLPADSTDPTFTDRYRAIAPGPQPRFLAVLAYDATKVLLNAIRLNIDLSKLPTRKGVEASLTQINYDGLSERIQFDADRDWAVATGWAYEWEDGALISASSQ